jgi:hypothetical protein
LSRPVSAAGLTIAPVPGWTIAVRMSDEAELWWVMFAWRWPVPPIQREFVARRWPTS